MLRAWPPRSGYCMLLFYDLLSTDCFVCLSLLITACTILHPFLGYDIHQVKLGGNFLIAAAIQSLSEVPFTASQLSVLTMFFAARSEENLERTDRFGGFVCGFLDLVFCIFGFLTNVHYLNLVRKASALAESYDAPRIWRIIVFKFLNSLFCHEFQP